MKEFGCDCDSFAHKIDKLATERIYDLRYYGLGNETTNLRWHICKRPNAINGCDSETNF